MPQEAHAHGVAVEERLTVIRSLWGEVLGVDAVSDDANFFEVGGDSLLLVALVERIRESTGLPLRAVDVLRAATVRGQADLLTGYGAAT
jgi:aryl carrier-like protein